MHTKEELERALAAAAKTFGLTFKDASPPKEGFVKANGLKMHYLDWGGKGTTILFLHGGNQTAHTWDLTCLQLRQQYHSYALDQRCHGETDCPKDADLMPFDQREDVKAAIEGLGLKKLVLIGMSMGGLNTMAYAGKYPERLQAVVIVDVAPAISKKGMEETGRFLQDSRVFDSIEHALDESLKFLPARPRNGLRYSLMHALKQRPDGKWTWKHAISPNLKQRGGAEEALMHYGKLWAEVKKIPCPTLVVHGEKSNVLDCAGADKLAKTLPKGRSVHIPGAGHTVQGDQPKLFAKAVASFLKEVL